MCSNARCEHASLLCSRLQASVPQLSAQQEEGQVVRRVSRRRESELRIIVKKMRGQVRYF